MKIGIVSNSDLFIPLASALAAQQQQVHLFYSSSPDAYINQKVAQYQKFASINIIEETPNGSNFYEWITKTGLDVCFILGYKRLINIEKLKNSSTQIFNIHFGPLPAYKGPTPIFWQLKHGEKMIGLTIHKLSCKFDDGEVVWKKEIENLLHFNYKHVELLFSQLCIEGAFFLLKLIMMKMPILPLNEMNKISSYQTKPKMNDVVIQWEKMEAEEVCNLVRACNPWNKGAFTFAIGVEIKIMDARILPEETDLPAGTIIAADDLLKIACCHSKVIGVNMLYAYESYYPTYLSKQLGLKEQLQFEYSFACAKP